MKKTLQQGLLAALIITITACGGGGSGGKKESSSASSVTENSSSIASSNSSVSSSITSSSSSSVALQSTTYNVSISAPVIEIAQNSLSNFFIPYAMADGHELTSSNFVVVIVNLAGEVVERIELDENDVTQNEDGTYSINVPGNPRLDCLIVTSLDDPIVLPEVANINSLTNLLFAPTTNENVDIDVGSTAGYVNLLEQLLEGANEGETDFADLDLDFNDPDDLALVESIINNVQEVINNQVVVGFNSIEEAISAIQEAVVAIVTQEALNITNPPTEEVTVAGSIQNGGVYWYEGREPAYIEYGAIVGEEQEVIYIYNGSAFEIYEDDYEGDLLLSDGEWINSSDIIAATSFSDDGSVILADPSALDHQFHVQSTLTFSLTGRNISEYFYANFNTRSIADILNPTATFGEGAIGLRLNVTTVNDNYSLRFEGGNDQGDCPWTEKNIDELGGNCDTLGIWFVNEMGGFELGRALASISDVFSADVASNVTGFVSVDINHSGDGNTSQNIVAQLLNNEAKTAKYFLLTWSNESFSATPVGESTWSYINLPGVEGNAAQAIRLEVPEEALGNGDFDTDENVFIMAMHNGFMRLGNFEAAGKLVETGFTLLNSAAHTNVQAAANYASPLVGSWFVTDTATSVTFLNNSEYIQLQGNDDSNCQANFELGYYSWNQASGLLMVSPDTDNNDDCGLSDPASTPTITINENTLTYNDNGADEGEAVLSKLLNDGIHGTWIMRGDDSLVVLNMLPNNTYSLAVNQFDDLENGQPGIESGTYSYNSETTEITFVTTADTNGEWGLSHPCGILMPQGETAGVNQVNCGPEGADTAITFAVEGNTLTIVVEADTIANEGIEDPAVLTRLE